MLKATRNYLRYGLYLYSTNSVKIELVFSGVCQTNNETYKKINVMHSIMLRYPDPLLEILARPVSRNSRIHMK